MVPALLAQWTAHALIASPAALKWSSLWFRRFSTSGRRMRSGSYPLQRSDGVLNGSCAAPESRV